MRPQPNRKALVILISLVVWLILPISGDAYSVLSHEAIIDALWSTTIVPLIEKRFPNPTVEQLHDAHAYAYGGAIIQDMGYYPHGSKFFSDLTHYVRSGDFVETMLRDAQDINEYAFALGAMSHYAADNVGHHVAVNRVVPMLYPDLARKYGNEVTYEDDPVAHVKTEFGFDVVEVAKGHYAPDAYRDFIGFDVAEPLLERAFKETYGLDLSAVLDQEGRAIGSYRYDVSKLIPKATRVAWQAKKEEIQHDLPGMTRQKFLYNLSRASYEKNWGTDYRQPTAGEKVLAFLFRLIPKIGPLKILAFRTPTPQAENLFEVSFNSIVDRYRAELTELSNGSVSLPNDNMDVGRDTPSGTYHLNDDTYANLLDRLAKQGFAGVPPELQADIERFYANPQAPNATKRNAARWSRVQSELAQLKSSSPNNLSRVDNEAQSHMKDSN
jgi:Zinc dependent phospholipase C